MLTGLTALLTMSFILSVTALAGPGPFWHQRKAGEMGNGVKISGLSPEKFQGKGSLNILITFHEVTCNEAQIKGLIYNNSLQGQGKLAVLYTGCSSNLTHCIVNEPVHFSTNAHLAWKWEQEPKELEGQKRQSLGQVPGMLLYHGEIEEGVKGLKEEMEFISISFKKDGVGECEFAEAPLVIKGYSSAEITPEGIEHWASTYHLRFRTSQIWQTYWNGSEQLGLLSSLKGGISSSAGFKGQAKLGPFLAQGGEPREIAIFEN